MPVSLRALVDTCSTSWPSVLLSYSPAVGGLLSAIALWVASRARSTSKDAQLTSEAAKTLWLLASDTPPATGPPGRHEDPEKR